jgi:hypothetical protein
MAKHIFLSSLLIIAVPIEVVAFRVYTTVGTQFLNCIQDRKQLFLNCGDTLTTRLLDLQILFLETRRNHKGPNQVGGGQQPFCQLPEIAALTQQSWFHHHSRHSWQTFSLRHCKMALHWSSYIVLQTFSTFSFVWLGEGWPHAHILQGKFPHIWTKKTHSEVHVLCMEMSLKAVLDISCVPDAHFPSRKQILKQMHCSLK